MTERSTFDPFEQRIAGELERYVVPAVDPRPAIDVAKVAMRPRGVATRTRNLPRSRRYLLLGLAAAFLVPAAYIGAVSVRLPGPEPINVVQPPRTDDPRPTVVPSTARTYVSLFVRRDDGPEPGLSIFAVRPDGSEALVRKVPDSIASGGPLSAWGSVSESGWLALTVEVYGGPWPMILVDLGDEAAEPWVVDVANLGGIGPRWGPTGLIAAHTDQSNLVIADPETRTTRMLSLRGNGLVGGGPSIIWTADGGGIVTTNSSGPFEVLPIDGGDPNPVTQVFIGRGQYGPGMATLRICSADTSCTRGADGSIERVEANGSARTIWQQAGVDRASAASFGVRPDEYWLAVDHDSGRQIVFVHLQDGVGDAIGTVNRDADWQFLGAPIEAPDQSMLLVSIDNRGEPAAVLAPRTGAPESFHTGHFAGFVESAASARIAAGAYTAPAEPLPAAGEAYALPSTDELVTAELAINPWRTVLGKASRDAVQGETDVRTFEVTREQPGGADLYLDCFGPSSVTVRSGGDSVTSPCLRAGTYGGSVGANQPIIVTASGDTSWRVVLYSPSP